MLFSKKTSGQIQHNEKSLYPVLYVTDHLKDYKDALIQKEVESLWELSLVNKSFSGVLERADNFQAQLMDFGQSFSSINTTAGQFSEVRESIGQTVSQTQNKVEDLKQTYVAIEQSYEEMEQTFIQLQAAVTSICKSINKIVSIADETNILAINASIEAARAGEAGKGFAVVADEINALSGESATATQKIDAILKDIIATIGDTNKVIDRNTVIVRESNEKLDDTVKIFDTMLKSSEQVIEETDRLKDGLGGIVEIKERLQDAMQQVERISQISVQGTTEISSSTEEQVTGVETILTSMAKVQSGIDRLAEILN